MDVTSLPRYPEGPPRAGPVARNDRWDLRRVAVHATGGLAAALYLVSLVLPAYYEGGGTLDGNLMLSGVECLLAPATITPAVLFMYPSWWANPVYGFGMVALGRGRHYPAAVAGVGSGLLAAFFAVQVRDPHGHHIRLAFWFWVGSMAALAAAVLVGVLGGPPALARARSQPPDTPGELRGGRAEPGAPADGCR